jgi:2-polyprenyl-3-methyl-5-hydroxy-6-metoxy-1,4-benzoquinol methylase
MNLTAKTPGRSAAEYRAFWMKKKVWNRLERPHHQERIKWCADRCIGESFIDVGCACGHSTNYMAGFHPGKWHGVDFDEQIVVAAREFFPAIKFFALGVISQLYTLGMFDSVVCSEVIEHIADDRELVAQLWAITGRKLILTTPNRFVDDQGHLRVYNEKQLRALFGMDAKVSIISLGRFWRVTAERR